ncbi:RNA 3'-terminal phosphate cyclase [Haladaptatus sp. W1]|uniref:RNA 3'-terminal phosphate cyclase n=1 Tax=Haladaptatus sp. W1 TaxID=1897478 RepID=UPI00373FD903
MIEIDGTVGGGQLLRTALSLSAVTETPFRMTDVRGSRPNPASNHSTSPRPISWRPSAPPTSRAHDSTRRR